MWHHRRLAPVKRVSECQDGGYVALQRRVLDRKDDGKCEACAVLLRTCKFDHDKLDEEVHAALHGGKEDHLGTSKNDNGDQGDDKDQDPWEFARNFSPDIEILQPGAFGKHLPYRCLVCRTKDQPDGKVGNLSIMKVSSIKHFLSKHLESTTHLRFLRARERAEDEAKVPCLALLVSSPDCAGLLFDMQPEFKLWTSFANLPQLAKHAYWQDASTDTWYIRSSRCKRQCGAPPEGHHPICSECRALGDYNHVPKAVLRFAQKYWAAQLLSSRLFQGAERAGEVEKEYKESAVYVRNPKHGDKIIKLKNDQLQQLVRASWLKTSDTHATAAQVQFVESIVKPALRVNVHSIQGNFADVVARFTSSISSGLLSESDQAALRVAAGALDGRLDNHPLLHGLALQCLRQVEKKQRGLSTMAGRRSKETEWDKQLILEAGYSLAATSGNRQLAQQSLEC